AQAHSSPLPEGSGRPGKRERSAAFQEESEEAATGEQDAWDLDKLCGLKMRLKRRRVSPVLPEHHEAFKRLLGDLVVKIFLAWDKNLRVSDKYLLAMVIAYFSRAGLPSGQYQRIHFFIALYLANDMEEDGEGPKQDILWLLYGNDRSQRLLFHQQRVQFAQSMGWKAWVSREECEEVPAQAHSSPPPEGSGRRTQRERSAALQESEEAATGEEDAWDLDMLCGLKMRLKRRRVSPVLPEHHEAFKRLLAAQAHSSPLPEGSGRPGKRERSAAFQEESEEAATGEQDAWDLDKLCGLKMRLKRRRVSPVLPEHHEAFKRLLGDLVVKIFLAWDKNLRVSDKYLLAMVIAYFSRAGLPSGQYQRIHFFIALYLANDMEEDDEGPKQDILWLLYGNDRSQRLLFHQQRVQFAQSMGWKAWVSREECEEVPAQAHSSPPPEGSGRRTQRERSAALQESEEAATGEEDAWDLDMLCGLKMRLKRRRVSPVLPEHHEAFKRLLAAQAHSSPLPEGSGRPGKRERSAAFQEESEEAATGEQDAWDLDKLCGLKMRLKRRRVSPVLPEHHEAFKRLLGDLVVKIFLAWDKNLRVSDKYLLAMVIAYFSRAGLPSGQYQRIHFFIALYLANDMEEDDEGPKQDILWLLYGNDRSQRLLFHQQRVQFAQSMGWKAWVSREECEEVREQLGSRGRCAGLQWREHGIVGS
ncbi:Speedy Protein E3, partial [Manis pentadactyla]